MLPVDPKELEIFLARLYTDETLLKDFLRSQKEVDAKGLLLAARSFNFKRAKRTSRLPCEHEKTAPERSNSPCE